MNSSWQIEFDEFGGNLAIGMNVLPEKTMRELNFTDCVAERWYYHRALS